MKCVPMIVLIGLLPSVGAWALDMTRVTVTARAHEESQWGNFKPELTVDGDVSARSSWRAEGDGQWISYDLGQGQRVSGVRLAFVQGDQRTYTFDVELSADGENWKKVYSGTSSGKTTEFETVHFDAASARHVRIVGRGGSKKGFEKWINIAEAQILTRAPEAE